jgi:hypothetical protein
MALASFASQYSQGLTGHTFSVVLSYILVSNDSSMASFKREDKKKTKKKNRNKTNKGYQFKETRRVLLMRGERIQERKERG